MSRILPASAVLALLLSSLPLAAQVARASADQRYCDALSDIYRRYVGNSVTQSSSFRRNDAAAEEAMAQCQRGNTAAAIPVLERKLTDNKFDLPPRG